MLKRLLGRQQQPPPDLCHQIACGSASSITMANDGTRRERERTSCSLLSASDEETALICRLSFTPVVAGVTAYSLVHPYAATFGARLPRHRVAYSIPDSHSGNPSRS